MADIDKLRHDICSRQDANLYASNHQNQHQQPPSSKSESFEERRRLLQNRSLHSQASSSSSSSSSSLSSSSLSSSTLSASPPSSQQLKHNQIMSKKILASIFAAELIGTFLLVIVGDGSIAAYVLTKQRPDLLATCLAFGVGAMLGTCVASRISGAHLNPAASLALALDGRLEWRRLPVYMLAQYLGGMIAALALYANYFEAIEALDGGTRVEFGAVNSTAAIFATYPAPYVSVWGALVDQMLGTAVLLFSLSAVSEHCAELPSGQPLLVALTIALVCVAFSPNCGAIFNPARDLGPRLATALVGYPSTFAHLNGLYWLVAGVVGPHVGAAAGVIGYKLLSAGTKHHQEHNLQQQHLMQITSESDKKQGQEQQKSQSPLWVASQKQTYETVPARTSSPTKPNRLEL